MNNLKSVGGKLNIYLYYSIAYGQLSLLIFLMDKVKGFCDLIKYMKMR